jgi:hypothetical protein
MTGESWDPSLTELADGTELLRLLTGEGERNGKSGHQGRQAGSDEKPGVDRVRAALGYIGDVDDHDRWITVGMCLHNWDATAGYQLWLEWSRGSDKFEKADCDRRWASFTPGGGLTIATLFDLAHQAG